MSHQDALQIIDTIRAGFIGLMLCICGNALGIIIAISLSAPSKCQQTAPHTQREVA